MTEEGEGSRRDWDKASPPPTVTPCAKRFGGPSNQDGRLTRGNNLSDLATRRVTTARFAEPLTPPLTADRPKAQYQQQQHARSASSPTLTFSPRAFYHVGIGSASPLTPVRRQFSSPYLISRRRTLIGTRSRYDQVNADENVNPNAGIDGDIQKASGEEKDNISTQEDRSEDHDGSSLDSDDGDEDQDEDDDCTHETEDKDVIEHTDEFEFVDADDETDNNQIVGKDETWDRLESLPSPSIDNNFPSPGSGSVELIQESKEALIVRLSGLIQRISALPDEDELGNDNHPSLGALHLQVYEMEKILPPSEDTKSSLSSLRTDRSTTGKTPNLSALRGGSTPDLTEPTKPSTIWEKTSPPSEDTKSSLSSLETDRSTTGKTPNLVALRSGSTPDLKEPTEPPKFWEGTSPPSEDTRSSLRSLETDGPPTSSKRPRLIALRGRNTPDLKESTEPPKFWGSHTITVPNWLGSSFAETLVETSPLSPEAQAQETITEALMDPTISDMESTAPAHSVRSDAPSKPEMVTKATQTMDHDAAKLSLITSEANKLAAQLEAVFKDLQARREESTHLHYLLVERGEAAAGRIMELENDIVDLEEELGDNESELKHLRLRLRAVETLCAEFVRCNRNAVDPDLVESIETWKSDWAKLREKMAQKRRDKRNGRRSDSGLGLGMQDPASTMTFSSLGISTPIPGRESGGTTPTVTTPIRTIRRRQ
ncbi:hypothetical protein V8F06_006865 [Rhypophila decipiens]